MTREERKEYMKAYYQAHKEQRKANVKAWIEANKEKWKEYQKEYYQAHKEEAKSYYEVHKEHKKAYYQAHKEQRKEYLKAWNVANKDKCRAYIQSDVNSLGQTKKNIRCKSRQILKQMNLNIPGYEIHHCFGYEDASKFIYISKELHLKIHQFLRDNKIDASSDHWMDIRDLVNSTDEFMYIKC